MKTILSLIFLVGCVGIWYFIKRVPNQKNRNISIIVALISFLLIGLLPSSKSDNKEKADAKIVTKETSSSEKIEILLEVPKEITADDSSKATIIGTTTPNADVTVGMGIIGDKTKADKDGNFTLVYALSSEKEEEITINATLDNSTTGTKVIVKQNEKVLAELAKKEAEEENTDKQEVSEEETNDITALSPEPTARQETVLTTLAQQRFDERYPYKGSKLHSALGVIQGWTQKDDGWFYKSEATIANAYGAERDATVEITITPTGPDSGNVTIIDY
ncbi:hypothetical protein [Enterococcus faecium]|uniref:hypothetical protein n=1 Tax=Enterococcus faecium TaxID=1352 RepID=UPI000BF01487|nr:hypothetical protein [Enterococcus faecium]PEH49344.1 hypothetical protein CRM75_16340 [Enterococcus faecium]